MCHRPDGRGPRGAVSSIDIELELADDISVPGDVTENLLRIVREAVTNAAIHGRAAHVRVRLERADQVRLVIEDDGRGFDPDGESGSVGFGIVSMRERAHSVGADLAVQSAPERGTQVEVTFR